jgi:hypothetical protein
MNFVEEVLSTGNNKIGYISPTFEPIKDLSLKESVQLITRKITIEFCKKNNLILPNFILNILDIYQDYTNTSGQIESRGIIQLYTIYFLLLTISSYWSAITNITNDLLVNKDNILRSISIPKPGLRNNNENTININKIKEKLKNSINSLKSILTPNKESNITIGIKYFLFKHPININWKFYDTILYHSIILLIIIYNLIYIIKTVNRFNKKQQEKIQLYVYHKKNIRQEVDKKVFQQLFLLFGFMVQHGSRTPFTKDYNMEEVYKKEKEKETKTNNKLKTKNNQQLFNSVEDKLQGINTSKNTTEFKSMGVYTILTTIFKLMYYHPFPFDASLLEKKLSKDLQQHPVSIANQNRNSQVNKIPKAKQVESMFEQDKEYLDVLGDLSKFFGDTTHMAIQGLEMAHSNDCHIDEHGKKKCNMNKLGQMGMKRAFKHSGPSKLRATMSNQFALRNEELRKYSNTNLMINPSNRSRRKHSYNTMIGGKRKKTKRKK